MIESLDVRSLVVVLVLGHAVAALLLFFDTRKRALYYDIVFMIGMALQAVAWMLILLRGVVPDLMSFELGNSLIFAGFCLEGISLLSLQRPVDKNWRLFFASVLAILLAVWWIPVPGQDMKMGIAAFITPLFFVFPAIFLVFFASRPSPLQKFIGTIILFYVFATVFRGAFILIAGGYSLTLPSFYQILFLLVQILAMILVSTGYILIRREFANENLERDITERKRAEETLQQKSQDLALKVRELNSLYEIARLIETSATTDSLLQAIADFLPSAWQYPELTCARVVVNDREFRSPTFRESSWMQDARIMVHGKSTGKIEIFFLGDGEEGKQPFRNGETALLSAIAERVGRVLERKGAEEALRESEEQFRVIFHNQQTGLLMVDAETHTIVDANLNALAMIGACREDVIGKVCHQFICPAETGKCPVTDLGKTVDHSERVLITNDGEHLQILKSVNPVVIKSRTYLLESFIDITERKQTEEALRQSEEKILLLMNSAAEAIYGIDMNGNCTFCNNACLRLIGYDHQDELLGKNMHWQIHGKHADGSHFPVEECRIFQAFRKGEGTHVDDEVLWRADGTSFPVEYWSYPQRHKGKVVGAVVTFLDITDRKRAEEALRESEEKYRAIINEMQDLFYRTDLGGKITMLSPSAAKMSGYDSIDQLIGRDVTSVYADPADHEKLLTTLRQRGSVESFPMNLKVRDGSIRHVTTSSHFYRDSNGNIAGVEGVIHDITEQQRAKDALRMANKKLHLLSSITRHDIRNQLMALMAFLELSVESIDKPAELEEFLKKNQKIAETITEQITFTKEYEEIGVMAPSWQDVGTCIGKAVEGLPVKDVHISVETAGLEIFADPLVEKVFYNLIDNALRYGGGRMTTIRITSHPEGSSLVLIFEDDGEGIAERDKKVIFNKGVGKNTGLGLYLTREILSITGITITETGTPVKGARFEMVVPEGGFRYTS